MSLLPDPSAALAVLGLPGPIAVTVLDERYETLLAAEAQELSSRTDVDSGRLVIDWDGMLHCIVSYPAEDRWSAVRVVLTEVAQRAVARRAEAVQPGNWSHAILEAPIRSSEGHVVTCVFSLTRLGDASLWWRRGSDADVVRLPTHPALPLADLDCVSCLALTVEHAIEQNVAVLTGLGLGYA